MSYTLQLEARGKRHRAAIRTRIDGKRVTIAQRSFDYPYEAEIWGQNELGKLQAKSGTPAALPTPSPVARQRASGRHGGTVSTRADDWLARRPADLAAGTRSNYSRAVELIKAGDLGRAKIDRLYMADVQRWMRDLADEDTATHTQILALKVLRMIYRDALVNRWAMWDATNGVAFPVPDQRPERFLSAAEDARLLEVCSDRMRLFALLGLDAGLRWGEAAGLALADIDLERGSAWIRPRQVVVRRTGKLRAYPKGKRARKPIACTPRLLAALRPAVLEAQGPQLFGTSNGTPLGYDNWRRDLWYPARDAAAFKLETRFHDLRHTFGSRLAAAGMPRNEIALLMGHADERTTARYIHAGDDDKRAALQLAALAAAAA